MHLVMALPSGQLYISSGWSICHRCQHKILELKINIIFDDLFMNIIYKNEKILMSHESFILNSNGIQL